MCGIFTLLNNSEYLHLDFIKKNFELGKGRGPEFSTLKSIMANAFFGFHRLAINGLNPESNQPIIINDVALICNGEIYNYKKLYEDMKVEPTTGSDCEVIIHCYLKYGMEHTLNILDGVFSFVLLDYRLCNIESKIYVARDPYGVRPLYMMRPIYYDGKKPDFYHRTANQMFSFASELKMLSGIKDELNDHMLSKKEKTEYVIDQFSPGTYSMFELEFKAHSAWRLIKNQRSYHKLGFMCPIDAFDVDNMYENIKKRLVNAVEKRCCTTERPIACLLSGGLDSSLIAALVNEYHKKNNLPTIETYSIGLVGSEDLKYAQIVADYLGTKHTEIVVTEEVFLNAIPDVVYAIESYDTTTVRASVGNWLLGKYIKANSEAKVIFNGDGSDELAGGYLYMNYAPDKIEYDKECRRLLGDIYMFDVLRSDKSISSHGLEPRTPFLDRAWTHYYMSIPIDIRSHWENNQIEKYLIRQSFSAEYYLNSQGNPLLPKEVLWRRKEAFSDGVSKTTRSLFEIIKEHATNWFAETIYPDFQYVKNDENIYQHIVKLHPNMKCINGHLIPKTAEQFMYRYLFEKHYKGLGDVLPYFWMPKFVNATDASARTLDIYNVARSD
jgi:asparagine synthase (glutamine-hydrolysing)